MQLLSFIALRLRIMLLLLLLGGIARADSIQDSLVIVTNKILFQQGDTFRFDVYLPKVVEMDLQLATLNVWIEDVNKYHQWKFRFPLVNGRMSADIAIDGAIPDGKYAVNFVVQDGMLRINGKVKNIEKRYSKLFYYLTTNTGMSNDTVAVADNGFFHLTNQVFQDTARLIFTPVSEKKVMANNLMIDLVSPLDSAFVPALTMTKMIYVGNQPSTEQSINVSDGSKAKYAFDANKFKEDHMLEEVVIKSAKKKEVDKYADKYVSSWFKGGQSRTFDGLEDPELSQFPDIFTYLQGKVAGLTISSGSDGGYSVKWRGSSTDFYLDEISIDAQQLQAINTNDIAMIKVFSPPAVLPGNMSGSGSSGGAGGAIAVYTKRGGYAPGGMTDNKVHRYYFHIYGYSPLNAVWK